MDDVRAGTCRRVALQNRAGGESISLQDCSGERPPYSIVSPPEGASELIQIEGRTDRLGSKSTPFMAPMYVGGTVEEKIWRKVRARAARIRSLTDADVTPD
jgi:hypothetical protein